MVELEILIPKYLYQEMMSANKQLKENHGYDLNFSEFLEHAYNGMIDIIENQSKIIYQLQYGKIDNKQEPQARDSDDIGRSYH